MKTQLTLKDIGLLAGGIHHSTVSRALRQDPRISESVRERVLRISRGRGYRPDPLLAAYNQQRDEKRYANASIIAYIESDRPALHRASANLAARARVYAQEAAAETGSSLRIFKTSGSDNGRSLGRVLYNRSIRGAILAPNLRSPLFFESLPKSIAIVNVGNFDLVQNFPSFYPDYIGAARLCAEKLSLAGAQRIGAWLPGPQELFSERLIATGLKLATQPAKQAKIFREEGPLGVIKWAATHRLDALVCDEYADVDKLFSLQTGKLPRAVFAFDKLPKAVAGAELLYRELIFEAVKRLKMSMAIHQSGPMTSRWVTTSSFRWKGGGFP